MNKNNGVSCSRVHTRREDRAVSNCACSCPDRADATRDRTISHHNLRGLAIVVTLTRWSLYLHLCCLSSEEGGIHPFYIIQISLCVVVVEGHSDHDGFLTRLSGCNAPWDHQDDNRKRKQGSWDPKPIAHKNPDITNSRHQESLSRFSKVQYIGETQSLEHGNSETRGRVPPATARRELV